VVGHMIVIFRSCREGLEPDWVGMLILAETTVKAWHATGDVHFLQQVRSHVARYR